MNKILVFNSVFRILGVLNPTDTITINYSCGLMSMCVSIDMSVDHFLTGSKFHDV